MSAPEIGQGVRRRIDGQLGVIEHNDDGKPVVRLDHGQHSQTVPYSPQNWDESTSEVDIPPMLKVRVAYEADGALAAALGDPKPKDWLSLGDGDKIKFKHGGPCALWPKYATPGGKRDQVWTHVLEVLAVDG